MKKKRQKEPSNNNGCAEVGWLIKAAIKKKLVLLDVGFEIMAQD